MKTGALHGKGEREGIDSNTVRATKSGRSQKSGKLVRRRKSESAKELDSKRLKSNFVQDRCPCYTSSTVPCATTEGMQLVFEERADSQGIACEP